MTQDQVMGLLRQILPIVGTLLAALGFSKIAAGIAGNMDIIIAIAGAVFNVASLVWALIANSKTSIVKSVSAMGEVNSDQLITAIKDPALKQAARDAASP